MNCNQRHVAIVTSSYPVRENPYAGIFVDRNVTGLEQQNIACTVIRPGPAENVPGTPENREIIQVPIRKNTPGSFLGSGFPETFTRSPLRSSRDLLKCVHGMARAIRNLAQSPDAIIAHWALPAGLAALMAIPKGPSIKAPKLIVWLHSSDVVALERCPGGATLARNIGERAHQVLAVSQDLASRFEKLANMPRGSVRVLYPGIKPGPLPVPIPALPYRAIAVGRLEKIKGFHLLVDLAKAMPHWEFTVVGRGAQLTGLQKAAANLSNLTVIPGLPPQEIRTKLSEHHLLVLPGAKGLLKRSEGLPTVLLEALDAGRPVVAADTGGVASLVSTREGYLVEPGHKAQIIAALRQYEDTAKQWNHDRLHLHEYAAKYSVQAASAWIKKIIA